MNIIDAHVVLQSGNWVLEAILPIEPELYFHRTKHRVGIFLYHVVIYTY